MLRDVLLFVTSSHVHGMIGLCTAVPPLLGFFEGRHRLGMISEKSVCDSLKSVSYLRVVFFGITFPVFSNVCEAFQPLGWLFLKRGQLISN